MAVRVGSTHDGRLMTNHHRVGSRAPLAGLGTALLALLLLPALALGADWTKLERVTSAGGFALRMMMLLAPRSLICC